MRQMHPFKDRKSLGLPDQYEKISIKEVSKTFMNVLKPEKSFYTLAILYAVAISFLTLAMPISVKTLINSVANTALVQPVIVLSVILFILLVFYGVLTALQTYVMEKFQQRFFARIASEIVMHNIYARYSFFKTLNRDELANRYFEIMNVQKNLPVLITGGFTLALQALVGLTMVSLYHPALLFFNICFIFILYIIWRLWGSAAIKTALALSNAKYNVARWLEEMARLNTEFKSENNILYALQKSEKVIAKYISFRKRYFRFTFAQIIAFLFVYAAGSAALLGLGGILVIHGELTLGQLVAAELILSGIFASIAKAGTYLGYYYELLPACDKISHYFRLPVEPEGGAINLPDHPHSIEFNNVQIKHRDRTARLHFKLEAGQKILANVSSHALQQFFTDLIRHYDTPAQGHVLLDSQDVHDLHMHRLRDQILVVDNVMMLECSILDYLRIYKTDISRAEIMDVLAKVHLDHIIVDLEDGLDTVLTPDGYPLSVSELVRLKLAAALVNTPTILVLTEIFDLVGSHFRHNILRQLADSDEFTLIYFSNRNDIDYFDAYLYMDFDKQTLFTDMNAYCAYQKEQSERCYATYVQKPKVPIKATKAKPRKKSEPPVSPTSSEES